MKYLVNDIYTAIQGEGALTGMAMVLLRLHGCPVGCPWCDTKETWVVDPQFQTTSISEALGPNPRYTMMAPAEIATYISSFYSGPKWVLVTGGEPADQPLAALVDALKGAGYKVALETSGTNTGHLDADFNWVCVSPKVNMPGGRAIIPEAVAVADELKYVICTAKDLSQLEAMLTTLPLKDDVQIALQPVSQNLKATKLCIETVQQKGWRLSIQTHKYLQIP